MATLVERNFKVQGNILSLYKPGNTEYTKLIQGIEVQLWHKAPMEKVFLGKALTDELGNFNIEFIVDSPIVYINNGKIADVFIEAYYNGEKLSERNKPDLKKGLVAYWKLDETSGSSAIDVTGNGHTGVLAGVTPPTWNTGKINNGLTFYGGVDGLVESYLSINPSDDFNFGTGDFTYAFWMKLTTPTDTCTIIDTGFSLPSGFSFDFTVPDIINLNVGGINVYTKTFTIPDGIWSHITIRRKGGQIDFFINGESLGTESCTKEISCPGLALFFGKFTEDSQNYDGMLDEIGIWKGHGLTNEEITLLYNNGTGRQYPF